MQPYKASVQAGIHDEDQTYLLLTRKNIRTTDKRAQTMLNYKPSIRRKITFGYYAIAAVVIGLSVFTLFEMNSLNKKIAYGGGIQDFFDATLDIRRFEKNYFLYENPADYRDNFKHVAMARSLLIGNNREFNIIGSSDEFQKLQDGLNSYEELMEQYSLLITSMDGLLLKHHMARKTMFENTIRDLGERITSIAKDIAKTERQSLAAHSNTTRNIFVISIIALSLVVVLAGQVLSRMVVRPLTDLEKTMEVIAGGKFEKVQIDSRDQEIVSLMTAFNKMVRELEQHQRHLVRADKLASLGTLLAGVAHELNNPLSNISSSNQILKEELSEGLWQWLKTQGPERRGQAGAADGDPARGPVRLNPAFVMELISQISEQTERAQNIVRSLLDFSRDKSFNKTNLLLRPLVEETVRFVKLQATARVRISIDIPADLTIMADKQLIQQALLNLIKNAVDGIEDEGAVFIKAKRHNAVSPGSENMVWMVNHFNHGDKRSLDDYFVDIRIRDTGRGIPAEVLPKIFDPFFTTKDVGKGTGLGLFIVHDIIEEHDGCIAVDSEPGKGTTFIIRLPGKE